jgi:uncharacterized protein YprB with RNaseH-like and TPR domain
MQIEVADYLRIAEKAGEVAMLDIEATNLKSDFGLIVVVSIKPYKKEPVTFWAKTQYNDKVLVREVAQELNKYQTWVTFYGKRFDIKFIKSRLMYWGMPDLPHKHHIDMYEPFRYFLNPSRRSQAHLLRWLDLPQEKMGVSPDVWARLGENYKERIEVLKERCESDTEGLEALYERGKHLLKNIHRV